MKTVFLELDYDYKPVAAVTIAYRAGQTYERVPEAAARAIVEAGVGRIVGGDDPGVGEVAVEAEADAGSGEGSSQGRDGKRRGRNRRDDEVAGSDSEGA